MAEVILLTMFEFGRTVRENVNGGTDHVHATAMLVRDGAVHEGHGSTSASSRKHRCSLVLPHRSLTIRAHSSDRPCSLRR
jgi:hypothetical protein